MNITAIVPVYNAKDTLRRCLDSILRQEWKLIIVNDGSTDGSGAICDEYQDRATVIHTLNYGPSRARNVGMDRAKGASYITFVDADDYIEGEVEDFWTKTMRYESMFYLRAPNRASEGAWGVWGKLYDGSTPLRFHYESRILEDVDFLYRYLVKYGEVIVFSGYKHTKPVTSNHASMGMHGHQQTMIGRAMDSAYRYTKADVGHAYTCLSIIHLIRACRKLSTATFWYVSMVLYSFDSKHLSQYRRARGDSVFIPFFIRRKWVLPTMIACHLKARKRYGT